METYRPDQTETRPDPENMLPPEAMEVLWQTLLIQEIEDTLPFIPALAALGRADLARELLHRGEQLCPQLVMPCHYLQLAAYGDEAALSEAADLAASDLISRRFGRPEDRSFGYSSDGQEIDELNYQRLEVIKELALRRRWEEAEQLVALLPEQALYDHRALRRSALEQCTAIAIAQTDHEVARRLAALAGDSETLAWLGDESAKRTVAARLYAAWERLDKLRFDANPDAGLTEVIERTAIYARLYRAGLDKDWQGFARRAISKTLELHRPAGASESNHSDLAIYRASAVLDPLINSLVERGTPPDTIQKTIKQLEEEFSLSLIKAKLKVNIALRRYQIPETSLRPSPPAEAVPRLRAARRLLPDFAGSLSAVDKIPEEQIRSTEDLTARLAWYLAQIRSGQREWLMAAANEGTKLHYPIDRLHYWRDMLKACF